MSGGGLPGAGGLPSIMTTSTPFFTSNAGGLAQQGQMIGSGGAGQFVGASTSRALNRDPKQPDTLGWREWVWDENSQRLKSPSQGTFWPEAELVVPHWDEAEAVRGAAGIHAHLVPKHWKILAHLHHEYAKGPNRVHGIVERFGKFVLGTEGWRAEWVIIRELMAPSTRVGLELEKKYPDVIVHYPDEEDESCTSEKSLKLGKGSRPTPRPRPSPQSTQSAAPSQALSPQSQLANLTSGNLYQALIASQNVPNLTAPADTRSDEAALYAARPMDRTTSQFRRMLGTNWFWWAFFGGILLLTRWLMS